MLAKIQPPLLCGLLCLGLSACGGATNQTDNTTSGGQEASSTEPYRAYYHVANNANYPLRINFSGHGVEDTVTVPIGESALVHEELTTCCTDEPAAAFDSFTLALQLDKETTRTYTNVSNDSWEITSSEDGEVTYNMSVTDELFYDPPPEVVWKDDAPSLIYGPFTHIYRYYYKNHTPYDIIADFDPWASPLERYRIEIPAGETKLVLELSGECCDHPPTRAFQDMTLYTPVETNIGGLQGVYGTLNSADWEVVELKDIEGFDAGKSYTLGLTQERIESILTNL